MPPPLISSEVPRGLEAVSPLDWVGELVLNSTAGGAQTRELEKGNRGGLLNSFPVTSSSPVGPSAAPPVSPPAGPCPIPGTWSPSEGSTSGEAPTPQAARGRCECAVRRPGGEEKGGERGTGAQGHTHKHTRTTGSRRGGAGVCPRPPAAFPAVRPSAPS